MAKGAPPKTWRSKAREAPASTPPPDTPTDPADALTMAAMQGSVEVVDALLGAGADVDAKDAIGVSPLHWAAFCGHGGVTQRLIAANADVTVRDREGRTALHVAAYESHSSVIRHLVAARADISAPDKSARARRQR
jgi:ankyrin repeat protein